jgi:hypothetical protein
LCDELLEHLIPVKPVRVVGFTGRCSEAKGTSLFRPKRVWADMKVKGLYSDSMIFFHLLPVNLYLIKHITWMSIISIM